MLIMCAIFQGESDDALNHLTNRDKISAGYVTILVCLTGFKQFTHSSFLFRLVDN